MNSMNVLMDWMEEISKSRHPVVLAGLLIYGGSHWGQTAEPSALWLPYLTEPGELLRAYGVSVAVDLVLDPQGRPRISYLSSDGLGCAWANDSGNSEQSDWRHRTVESNDTLAANYEVLPFRHCTASAWINGQRSGLALDADGNPVFGCDAQHIWSGTYTDPPWNDCYSEDTTIARLAFLRLTPTLSFRRSGTLFEISFENGQLESAPDLRGPWSTVSPATSPLPVVPDQARRFYRVRQ